MLWEEDGGQLAVLLGWARREGMMVDSRPMNSASAVSVPYSLSNLSSSGVKARTFMSMWKKPRWMNG